MPKRKNIPIKHAHQVRSAASGTSALPLGAMAGVTLIIVTVFLAYLPSISGGFILDDNLLLTENQLIKASDGLYKFWCTTEATDYWPVANTTLWIEWRLWGMHPTGYRVTNLILHVAETLLVWLILRKLSIPGAFLAAMIFAVHPVNVESVSWIAQRKDMLAVLFFLVSIYCYLKNISSSCSDNSQHRLHTPCSEPAHGVCGVLSGRWYWISLAAFVLAMLSKVSVAILPVLLLVIVWWMRPLTRWVLLRTAPFFAVAVVLTWVNMWFQTRGTDVVIRNAGFTERLLGAGGVVWFYLYKAILPFDLAFVYPQWHIETGNPLWWLPLLAVFIVTAALWLYRKSWSRPFLFAWGFFCVALAPVMGFMDVGFMKHSLVADHYQHIALIGVIALVSAGWNVWLEHARDGWHWAATIVIIVSVGVLAFLTWRQSGLYRDAITLYEATLEKNPGCWMAHNNLGIELAHAGRLREAVEHYTQALRLKPDNSETHNNLGNTLIKIGRRPEAIEHYKEALRIKPNIVDAYNNLGNAFKELGQYQQAIDHYEKALRLNPNYLEAHYNLGLALAETGRPEEAIEHYRQALRLGPNIITIWTNMALAYANMRQSAEAIAAARKALELARSQGQAAQAKQIEDWLNSYQRGKAEGGEGKTER